MCFLLSVGALREKIEELGKGHRFLKGGYGSSSIHEYLQQVFLFFVLYRARKKAPGIKVKLSRTEMLTNGNSILHAEKSLDPGHVSLNVRIGFFYDVPLGRYLIE